MHKHWHRHGVNSDATDTGTALGQVSMEEGMNSMGMGMGEAENKYMDGC